MEGNECHLPHCQPVRSPHLCWLNLPQPRRPSRVTPTRIFRTTTGDQHDDNGLLPLLQARRHLALTGVQHTRLTLEWDKTSTLFYRWPVSAYTQECIQDVSSFSPTQARERTHRELRSP